MLGKLTDTTLMQLYTLANRHGYQAFARHAKNLLAPTQQPSGEVTDDKNVYVSVRFKDAVVRRSITTAELDSFASREVPARLFGSVVLGAIDAARSNGSRYPS